MDEPVPPNRVAAVLLDEILDHGDDNGALANASGDDLRDALSLAADRLRTRDWRKPRGPWMLGCRRLVAEVWWLVQQQRIDARCPAADAALDMRDMIDTSWWPDPEQERRPFQAGGDTDG